MQEKVKEYLEGLISTTNSKNKNDYSHLNSIIMDCMLETESLFFPAKTMLSQPQEYIESQVDKDRTK